MSRLAQTEGTAAAVLCRARTARQRADRAEVEVLEAALDWAVIHAPASVAEAAVYWEAGAATGVALAGQGAPQISEYAVAEFAAALAMSPDAGRALLGQVLELRYRLPRLWAQVVAGRVPVWRARRVARETIGLSPDAAGFVDAQVAGFAHRIGPVQLDRLIEEAIARHMPEQATAAARVAADRRHVSVWEDQVSFVGLMHVEADLDLADALDFNTAVGVGAAQLAALGSAEGLDARRALAVGVMARHQLTLDYPSGEDSTENTGTGRARARRRAGRRVVLYVHLSESALTGAGCGVEIARVENTRTMVTADQVRTWCATPDATVTVKPVLDLEAHVRVDQWEVPDRLGDQVIVRDGCCVFPWCTRPARACHPDQHPCDLDHVEPYARSGETCPCNLAPLCRRHHRLKTHTAWTYTILEPGSYLWTSPHRYQFLRDHTGTRDVTSGTRRTGHPPDQ